MWLSRFSVLLFPCFASLLYQLFNPLEGWFSIFNVCLLSLLGYSTIAVVIRTARSISTNTLLNATLSIIIGFGATTFLVFCAEQLSHGTIIHPLIGCGVILTLLCSLITVSYVGLQNTSLFQAGSGHDGSALRTFILDQSALEDGRVVDLARMGLFDGQIIVPSFLPQELKNQVETADEPSKARARRALEALRRLESIPHFTVLEREISSIDGSDLSENLSMAAKRLHATLLTNETLPCRLDGDQGPHLSVDTIVSALRPAIPKGELLLIKIQRLGKEAKQGIGYLEDGTMVVVNGGGDYLGRTVRTQVLSQKYSSSGKIIFCNVREEEEDHVCGHPEPVYGV